MNTVLITGASTGIGYECAKIFLMNGWNVVATMRNPENAPDTLKQENVLITKMDVTDNDSIKKAIQEAIYKFGQIDVLVNNAGYYSIGVVEAIPEEEIRRQIETNLLGLILTTKAVLPYMREKRNGLIVNLSSVAGRTTVPLQSIYHATKWGVEGFSQSLQYEVEKLGIDVVLIEPGVIKTDFYSRSMKYSQDEKLTEYQETSKKVGQYLINGGNNGSSPSDVAEKIYRITTSRKRKMQYVVGKSTGIVTINKLLPTKIVRTIIKKTMMK
ncbi:MAG: SDR family oxidoreductase [Lachnospiraceae bacterium]|nr:SDR family oxidoreductase [Candidatus Colinaster equi]